MTTHPPTEILSTASNPPRIWLAPMEGVVDWVLRDLLTGSPALQIPAQIPAQFPDQRQAQTATKRLVPSIDACVTEFIRVTDRRLPDAVFFRDCPELKTGGRTRAGVPVYLQLLGGQPGPMAENAFRAFELGAFGIDLNFGCPAKTVNRHDGGAALLKTPERVFAVTQAVRNAVPRSHTVSAKVRLGFSDKSRFLEIAQAAESAGASWLTVHARTRDEGYRPPAHWEYIAQIRESLRIPVIANGDVWTPGDYERCRKISGCQDVMIGRGLISKPDLAFEIKTQTPGLSWFDLVQFLRTFAIESSLFRHEKYAVARLKQMLNACRRSWPEASELFDQIKRHQELAPLLQHLEFGSLTWNGEPAHLPITSALSLLDEARFSESHQRV